MPEGGREVSRPVKAGDLAIMKSPRMPDAYGLICEVLAVGLPPTSIHRLRDKTSPRAHVRFPRPVRWPGGRVQAEGRVVMYRLVPIDPGEGPDETLSWCPVPSTPEVVHKLKETIE